MNLPNRKERRKAAKEMGLLNNKKNPQKEDSRERTKVMGNLIRLRNLTEQRNRKKDN